MSRNLNDLSNQVQMNTKNLSKIAIVKRVKLENRCKADRNFSWDQKKLVDREIKLISQNFKETVHFLSSPNHITKISSMLPKIWLPNLR